MGIVPIKVLHNNDNNEDLIINAQSTAMVISGRPTDDPKALTSTRRKQDYSAGHQKPKLHSQIHGDKRLLGISNNVFETKPNI